MLALLICGLLQGANAGHSDVTLVSKFSAYEPESPFTVALRFKIEPGWHIYWRNPGDSGQEPRVKWSLPPNWRVDEIRWPAPKVLSEAGITTFVYEKEVFLLATIHPRGRQSIAKLGAEVSWLVCSDVCLPESKCLAGSIPSAMHSVLGPAAPAIDQVGQMLPRRGTERGVASVKSHGIELAIDGLRRGNYRFFPYETNIVGNEETQTGTWKGDRFVLKLKQSDYFDSKARRLKGILVRIQDSSTEGERPIEIDVPLLKS